MTVMVQTEINGQWSLFLPEHRAARAQWVTGWEPERLASMYVELTKMVVEWDRWYERPTRPVIVDVGAEEGDFPALWSKWGCDVILVEPNPKVWPNIKAIWQANSLRMPLAWWVGFAAPEDIFDPIRNDIGSGALCGPDGWPFCADGPVIGDHGFRHLAEQATSTPCIKLDTLCAARRVDAITIDTEGSELQVLSGAVRILTDDRPLVWVSGHTDYEWNDTRYSGLRPKDVVDYMAEFGYRGTLLAEDHEQHWFFEPEV